MGLKVRAQVAVKFETGTLEHSVSPVSASLKVTVEVGCAAPEFGRVILAVKVTGWFTPLEEGTAVTAREILA